MENPGWYGPLDTIRFFLKLSNPIHNIRHMNYLKQQLALLLKNPFLSFLFYYVIWELLYMLTGLPGLLDVPLSPNWDNFLFNYGLLGSIKFLLFYLMAFLVIPKLFIQQKKIRTLVLICIGGGGLIYIYKIQD